MELYDTEEQQVEAIKDWWKENGKSIIFGTIIGLGGLFGWRYYQDSVQTAQEAASTAYTKTIQTLQAQGADAEAQVSSFIDANQDSEYSVLAALQLAKVQVEAENLEQAKQQLVWAKNHSKDAALLSVISYRLARIEAELTNYDAALTELGSITDSGWNGRVAELRGDILLSKGDADAARTAYTEASQAEDASPTLQMKLDDLAK
ncbi:YfgM family protein [Vibrio sp.]|uniref:YfgM family protein n=1 Tax=Vibrio sp. TaxID=678 RepID=UPI003D0C0603